MHELDAAQVFQEVAFCVCKDSEHLRSMIMFLYRDIIAVNGTLSYRIEMVVIIVPIVAKIMAGRCDQNGKLVQVTHQYGVHDSRLMHD